MPEIVQNPYGVVDYHNDAQAHYHGSKAEGMKNTLCSQSPGGTAPPPPPKDIRYSPGAAAAARAAGVRSGGQDSAYPTIPIQRRPVGTADNPAAQQAEAIITRKPVREKPAPLTLASFDIAPQQQPKVLSPDGNIRTIYRNKDGKIDPSTIKTGPAGRSTPPASPSVQAKPRRTSQGSFLSFGKGNRADTGDSSTTRRSGSRRGSFTDAVKSAARRLSGTFEKTAKIVQLKPEEREDWMEARREEKKRSASQRSNEREAAHRANPKDRPSHQKDALVQKNKRNSHLAHDHLDTETNYQVMLEQREFDVNINKAHRKSWGIEAALAAEKGEPIPKSPTDLPVADLSLDPAERHIARQNTHDKHIDELAAEGRVSPTHFTTGEKIALALSKTVDPLKPRGRSNTAESAMSFGMTDVAPAGTMLECTRCHRAPEDFLHSSGVCNACHKHERQQKLKAKVGILEFIYKQEDSGDRTQANSFPQDQSGHDPVSPPYMILAGRKKIRKVRQTIYEDPGNPFATDEQDDQTDGAISIFSMPFHPGVQDPTMSGHSYSKSPFGGVQKQPPTVSTAHFEGERQLLNGRPFDDAVESPSVPSSPHPSPTAANPIHAPTPQRHGTPTIIQNHRRSVSVAVLPGQPTGGDASGEYVAPRTDWRRESLRYPEPPEQIAPMRDNTRDTKFYGFYDDILEDYEKG
ncbi:hypothetical protein LTR85_004068 [Meristemomyces frigidus]|nr:hypothetical protein LTR85_004068 [Meristemomyces frigidus]